MARPRIGFDVSPLHAPHPPGVVRATRGLVEALERRGVLEVLRLAPDGDVRRWRHTVLPVRAKELELAGIHSPVSAFPRGGPGARVQTVHELPWKHGVAENADWKHRFWAAWGPWRADAVLCPSEFVAADLRRRVLPGASKIHVVPWGVGAPFGDLPAPGQVDEIVLGKFRLGQDPLALCVGAVREKKNLAAALHGLAELRRRSGPRVQLVVIGPETAQLRRDLGTVAKLGLSRFVSTLSAADDGDLASLMRLASAVVVLSKSEGFAFPVLEGLASGAPVVVARGTAQAELAGSAGIAVEAEDPSSVASGLERAVDEREALRFGALERAAAFTWDACAEKVEALWTRLA
jgi:glycosyltransferase involved in cell wall biosynthesis